MDRLPAARRVYDTLELRREIFGLVDRKTLMGMFRLEKGALASVAEIVYRKVHVDEMKRFHRTNARHTVYLAAVRVLDRSGNPLAAMTRQFFALDFIKEEPTPFKPKPVLRKVAELQRRFPNVHTILYLPKKPADDAYDISIRGDIVHVALQSRVTFDINESPPSGPLPLPATPICEGMEIEHTFSIRFRKPYGQWQSEQVLSFLQPAAFATLSAWKDRVYHQDLDPRVVNIDADDVMEVAFDDVMSFLERRQAGTPTPIKEISIPCPDVLTADCVRRVGTLLPPDLRKLEFPFAEGCTRSSGSCQSLIDILDAAFPRLEEFYIGELPKAKTPLHGMSNLLVLQFELGAGTRKACSTAAKVIHQLGSAECVYLACFDEEHEGKLKEMIADLKAKRIQPPPL